VKLRAVNDQGLAAAGVGVESPFNASVASEMIARFCIMEGMD
jgi:hypothetical protein